MNDHLGAALLKKTLDGLLADQIELPPARHCHMLASHMAQEVQHMRAQETAASGEQNTL
jgi:hypothetical protein